MVTVSTNTRTINYRNLESSYSPSDFVGTLDTSDRRTNDKAYVILDGGFIQAIVLGQDCEEDALDEAADNGKLGEPLTDDELKEYEQGDSHYVEHPGVSFLGNYSKPYDIESFDVWRIPARLFREEMCLMTLDRVLTHLETRIDELREITYSLLESAEYTDDKYEAAKAKERNAAVAHKLVHDLFMN